MPSSVSYVLKYSAKGNDAGDRVGGLPRHLPQVWPRCQMCQHPMAFVGQIYAKPWFPLDGQMALQFYACDEDRKTIEVPYSRKKSFSISEPLHLEFVAHTAAKNPGRKGVRSKFQPKLYITYEPVKDSMDQQTFLRRRLPEQALADKHLRSDKLGGMFPYDGYDGPAITRKNRMIGQLGWVGIGGLVYLYQDVEKGIYAFRYW
jgi:hypothetical protein